MNALTLFPRLLASPDPDCGLVKAAQRGDPLAFDRLVRRHEGALLGFLNARLLSEEAAREVGQEALLAAWEQIQRFSGQSRFKTWLFGIASHKAADYLRKHHGPRQMLPLEEVLELHHTSEAAWDADPQRLIDRTERELRVRDAVSRLPESQRQMIELYYFGELTLREIAGLLGLNLSTLKYQFYQAHRTLRPALGELLDVLPPASGRAPRPGHRGATSRPDAPPCSPERPIHEL